MNDSMYPVFSPASGSPPTTAMGTAPGVPYGSAMAREAHIGHVGNRAGAGARRNAVSGRKDGVREAPREERKGVTLLRRDLLRPRVATLDHTRVAERER